MKDILKTVLTTVITELCISYIKAVYDRSDYNYKCECEKCKNSCRKHNNG